MRGSKSYEQIVSEFYASFRSNHMILFVGSDPNAILDEQICSLPWSCIITSVTTEGFSALFSSKQRRVKDLTSLPSKLLDRNAPPVLRLFGLDSEKTNNENQDELSQLLDLGDMVRIDKAKKIYNAVLGTLDCVNQMIVVGYDSDNDSELPLKDFLEPLTRILNGCIHFYGVDASQSAYEKILLLSQHKNFPIHNFSLSELLEQYEGFDHQDDPKHFTEFLSENVFYKGGIPCVISNDSLLQTRHFATLLTERSVFGIRPYGRVQQAEWFMNFLTLSPTEGPQWYGYLPNSQFYLKRNFEDKLVALVRKMLSGSNPVGDQLNRPIILEGEPGSSKSITLAALAFRIYQEHINPVIFIKDDSLSLHSGVPELNELDELMHQIEISNGPDTRILLIWDCSSYRSIPDTVVTLLRQLENRGRRFVLVCSAYVQLGEENDTKYFRIVKEDESKSIVPAQINEYDVKSKNKCLFIHSSREMTSAETYQLKQIFKDYAGIKPELLNIWWNKLAQEYPNPDIFIYLYKLISLIRPKLEFGLSREQLSVSAYVKTQIEKIIKNYHSESIGALGKAIADSGIDWSKLGIDPSNFGNNFTERHEQVNLQRFNECIALFSRFKIETPYSIAMYMLNISEMNDEVARRELFKLVTTQIPWIRYGENAMGDDFTFRFRNSYEADIFLVNNEISAERQVEIICDILDYYGNTYQNGLGCSFSVMRNLQQLLRLMGPNSSFTPFLQSSNMHAVQHSQILKYFNRVLEKLRMLREDVKVLDYDATFANLEITFLREYYGVGWDDNNEVRYEREPWNLKPDIYSPEMYESRINHLKKAIDIAMTAEQQLDKSLSCQISRSEQRYLTMQSNSLAVELCLCKLVIERIQADYIRCCQAFNRVMHSHIKSDKIFLPYKDAFKRLLKTINNDPTNGYAYNALFSLFEHEYKHCSNEVQRLTYLSEINVIIDNLRSDQVDIINRGAKGQDEISRHLATITSFAQQSNVTIDDILNDASPNSPFMQLYSQMLDSRNPAAIMFVCQKEFSDNGLSAENLIALEGDLNQKQLQTCQKVRDFMISDDNFLCVQGSPFALAFLLRTTWMLFNKHPMFNGKECQLTYLNQWQWREIEKLGRLYYECAKSNPLPRIILIYALSVLQTSNRYDETMKLIDSILEERFFSSPRMRVPYMICKDEEGTPKNDYSGRVLSFTGKSGFMKINGIPNNVRFHLTNLELMRPPTIGTVLNNLEIGIGYTGFSVYTSGGRKSRGTER